MNENKDTPLEEEPEDQKLYQFINGEYVEVRPVKGDGYVNVLDFNRSIGTAGALNITGKSFAFDSAAYGDRGTGLNLARGASAGALSLLSGASDFLSGYSMEKKAIRAEDEYNRNQSTSNGLRYEPVRAVGGESVNAANVEGGEVVQTEDGKVQQVQGPKHEQGGVSVESEQSFKVLSDRIILGDMAKVLNKEFKGLKARKTDTIAAVFDKYSSILNLEKNMNKFKSLLKKAADQNDTDDAETKRVNNSFIKEKLVSEKAKLAEKTLKIQEFTKILYAIQEQVKGTAKQQMLQPEPQPQLGPDEQAQLQQQQQPAANNNQPNNNQPKNNSLD